jgi:hypothetical protein
MAHFNVTIPDDKVTFFKELLHSLNFAEMVEPEDFEISENHKVIIDQRLKNYQNNPDSYLNWEDVQKDIEKRLWVSKLLLTLLQALILKKVLIGTTMFKNYLEINFI